MGARKYGTFRVYLSRSYFDDGDQTKGDQSFMQMHETKPQSIKYFLGSC